MLSGLLLLALLVAAPSAAYAAGGPDTSDGRIDGDVSASAGIGATFGPRGPRAAADLRLRYLWTAGVFATYEDGPLFGSSSEPRRAFATGLELRPLFLVRWLQGLETGNAYVDMTIDSFGLELGAVFAQPEGRPFGSKPGLQAGIGVQIPVLPNASGPLIGLHGGARWSDSALGGRTIEGPSDRALYLLVTVAWQQVFGAHIVDLGDRAPR
ncbi:MAG: hypothetical protein JWO86_2350 [Myxococcaceae bacterium]|nr:hypothetical protein [Myxococcaceae bacterium]MEA2751668.1 hypothetical protein [Myxococcales bacterium]